MSDLKVPTYNFIAMSKSVDIPTCAYLGQPS